jgi:hypothetical protein
MEEGKLSMIDVNIFLFSDFETLDVFGPVEILGKLDSQYHIRLLCAF